MESGGCCCCFVIVAVLLNRGQCRPSKSTSGAKRQEHTEREVVNKRDVVAGRFIMAVSKEVLLLLLLCLPK